jgi:hypothetical protein
VEGPKAARWIAAHLGLEHVHTPRGLGSVEETALADPRAAAEEPKSGERCRRGGF